MNPTQPTPEQLPTSQVPEVPAVPVSEAPSVAPASTAPVSQLPVLPIDPPVAADAPVVPAPIEGAAPVIAADVDVIEKEWVDHAEAEVKRTAGDPHAEEEAIEDLQIDYLKKRYDHTVDKATE